MIPVISIIVIALIGGSIGYFGGQIHHDHYNLSHLLNGLIGLVGALLAALLAGWLLDASVVETAYFDLRVWLAAAVGAFMLVRLAGFLRGRQYE